MPLRQAFVFEGLLFIYQCSSVFICGFILFFSVFSVPLWQIFLGGA